MLHSFFMFQNQCQEETFKDLCNSRHLWPKIRNWQYINIDEPILSAKDQRKSLTLFDVSM